MTFILLACTPMFAAALLLYWEPGEPRHRRPTRPPLNTPRRAVIHRPLAPPFLGAGA